ncbi:DUF2027 domain-containing protein [Bacteroidales bacterium OttesenSCG-928-M11]|nr:DUF2027 domain-containing protein [Bacteroidales bacterium OttesenSCG-928-M11]
MVKIGDRVRFLNSTGGGIVRRFQNKEIVLVEEEDGFETPVLIRECVVIETNENNYAIKTPQVPTEEPKITASVVDKPQEKYEIVEVVGGDKLNVFLAYLPMDIKNLGKSNYETYLINDSNYFLFFNYMSRNNNAWISRHAELIEPNTRLFIEEFSKEQINDIEKVCVQFIAFKQDKPYSLKNSYSIELRIDGVKFYKLHSFKKNDFFEEDALVYPLVTNDSQSREMLVSATDLQEIMTQKNNRREVAPSRKETGQGRPRINSSKKDNNPIIEVDLHINQLLDTTAGMNNADILNVQLDKFREVIEANKTKKGQKIIFIHGKGEGVLRKSITDELNHKYKQFSVQDASFKEYGFGATLITIR